MLPGTILPGWFVLLRPRYLISLVAIAMSGYHLFVANAGEPMALIHRPLHVLGAVVVLFWTRRVGEKSGRFRRLGTAWDILMTVLASVGCGYLLFNNDAIQQRMFYVDPLTPIEIVSACALLFALLEAARRTIGWVMVVVVLAFLAYATFGYVLPYPFWHRGYPFMSVLETVYLSQEGIWGTPVAVAASYIFLFVLFGSFLVATGAGAFFSDVARSLTGKTVGGPAKTAIVSSGFMGMLSGSPAANVVTTGAFTIPAMKRVGYDSNFAAAVEAVASSGGQITPPILGAAAFIMMEFVGVPYLEIIQISIIPAVLYFIAVFCMVDLEARRTGLRVGLDDDAKPIWAVLRRQGYLLLSVVAMMWALIDGYTPATSSLWAIASLMILVIVLDPTRRRQILRICRDAMDEAPRVIGPVTTACAVGGIIVGVVTQTGLGLRMSTIVLTVAGQSQLLMLVLTMLAAIILGMGMPTSGAYIILATLLAPGLIDFGVPVLAAHMFVLYCAGIANITPPVAIASYAAAAIANANPWKTSVTAFRLGLSSFIIPFMFVYGVALLGIGTPMEVGSAFISAILGVAVLSVAIIGWLLIPLLLWERAAFFATSLLLIVPGWLTDGTGFLGAAVLLGCVYARYVLRRRNAHDIGGR